MSNLTPEEAARTNEIARSAMVIPRKHLAPESDLMVSKWPAYRFMSPLAATRQFRLDYIQAYKNSHRINVDLNQAEKLKIAEKIDFSKNNSALTQLWMARQIADQLGMPYPAYLEFCFDFAMRRQRHQPPQPNQLGPNLKTAKAWAAAFEGYWTFDRRSVDLMRLPAMPQYFTGNDLGLPAQRAFRTLLVEIGATPVGSFNAFYGQRVVSLGQLTDADCLGFRRPEQIASAIRDARSTIAIGLLTIHVYSALSKVEKMQACFGVPGIDTATGAVCATCRHSAACDVLRGQVLSGIEARTGHADPIVAKRRADGRKRTAKNRAKAKRDRQLKRTGQTLSQPGVASSNATLAP